jgi:hypothetical protein
MTENKNPVLKALLENRAPVPVRVSAARGLLPLAQPEMMEALVILCSDSDPNIAKMAHSTLLSQETESLVEVAKDRETSESVLSFFVNSPDINKEVIEAALVNTRTPDGAILDFTQKTADGALLELVAINQQRLIRNPAIVDAVLANPNRTTEAERRVRELRKEFFEKDDGKRVIEELRARGMEAAAEFIEAAESVGHEEGISFDDAWAIAEHIEVSDADIDDSWLPSESLDFYIETVEQRQMVAEKIINDSSVDMGEGQERISLIRRIMMMTVKDRIRLALKGDRESRLILVRDPNKLVSSAVLKNPRITDQEVEKVAAMRTVPEEVLRLIALNRTWMRVYMITHNLVRNPRTPIPIAMDILPRLHSKDIANLSQNRNISGAVRNQALRLSRTRTH